MTNASLSINQLLGSGAVAKGKKIAAFNVGDALLGNPASTADFQALLASLAKVQPNTVGKILAASTIEATTGAKNQTGVLGETVATPELLAALKSLTPEQLETLKLNAVIDPSELGATTLGILDALSSFSVDGEELPEFFTVVDDPKLANALANLAAQVKALQIAVKTPEAGADPVAVIIQKPEKSSLQGNVANALVLDSSDFEAVLDQLRTKSPDTLTIASADVKAESDGFDALKKLAFADLAPFLTQPRVVRIDNRTVMKVAQGPSFLNDEGTDATAMTLLSGLVPVVSKVPETAQVTASTPSDTSVKPAAIGTQGNFLPTHLAALVAAQNKPVQQTAAGNSQPSDTDTALQTQPVAEGVTKTPDIKAPKIGAPLLVTVTPLQPAVPQAAAVQTAKGLENGLGEISEFDLSSAFDDALRVHADQTLPLNSSSSLIAARSAGAAHPSTHLVTATIQRAMGEMPAGAMGERQFVIQLDPPNMGRLKITLDFIENNKVKARLLAERPETISLLQKDAAVLERALQGSGFDASAPDSLSFDLADSGDFSQGFGGGAGGHEGKGKDKPEDGTDFATIENVMQVFVDPETGLTHINVVI